MIRTLTPLALLFAATALADTPKEFKDQEAIMEKFFKAYNKGDAKGCFEDYIESFKGMAEQLYPVLIKPNKDKYGEYKSHTFVKDGSVATDDITVAIDGHDLWRRSLPEGGVSAPVPVAGALLVSTTRYGLFLFSPLDGAVIDGLETGSGFAMTPAASGRRAFVMSNQGALLGLHVDGPVRAH